MADITAIRLAIDGREGISVMREFDRAAQQTGRAFEGAARTIARAEQEVARAATEAGRRAVTAEQEAAQSVETSRRRRARAAQDNARAVRTAEDDIQRAISEASKRAKELDEDGARSAEVATRRRVQSLEQWSKATRDELRKVQDLQKRAAQPAGGAGLPFGAGIYQPDVRSDLKRFSRESIGELERESADVVARAFTRSGTAAIGEFIKRAESDVSAAVQRARRLQTPAARPKDDSAERDRLRRTADAAAAAARNIGEVESRVLSGLGPAGQIIAAVSDQTGGLARNFELAASNSKVLPSSIAAIGLAAAGIVAVGTAFGFAVAKGVEFERSLDRVRALADPALASVDELRDATLKYSDASGIGRLEEAEAVVAALTNGYREQADAVEILGVANDLARTKLIGVADAVKIVDSNLDIYGRGVDEARKTADQLFVGARLGGTEFREFSSAVADAGKIAAPVGVQYEELIAILSGLGDRFPVQEAVQGLSTFLVRLGNESDPLSQKLRDLGVDASSAGVRLKGLPEILRQIKRAAEETDDPLATLSQVFGNARVAGALLNAVRDADALKDRMDAVKDSTDSVADAIARVDESSTEEIRKRLNALSNTSVRVGRDVAEGTSGVFLAIERFVGDVIDKLSLVDADDFYERLVDAGKDAKVELQVAVEPPDAIAARVRANLEEGARVARDVVKSRQIELQFLVDDTKVRRDVGRLIARVREDSTIPVPDKVSAAAAVLERLSKKKESLLTIDDQRALRNATDLVSDFAASQEKVRQTTAQLSAQVGDSAQREAAAASQRFDDAERDLRNIEREQQAVGKLAGLRELLARARSEDEARRGARQASQRAQAEGQVEELRARISEAQSRTAAASARGLQTRESELAVLAAQERAIDAQAATERAAIAERIASEGDVTGALREQLELVGRAADAQKEAARAQTRRVFRDEDEARARETAQQVASLQTELLEGLEAERAQVRENADVRRQAATLAARDGQVEAGRLAEILSLLGKIEEKQLAKAGRDAGLRVREGEAQALQAVARSYDEQAEASRRLREIERERLTEELRLLGAGSREIEEQTRLLERRADQEEAALLLRERARRQAGPFGRSDAELAEDVAAELRSSYGEIENLGASASERFDELFAQRQNVRDFAAAGARGLREELLSINDGADAGIESLERLGATIQREIFDRLVAQPIANFFQNAFGSLLGSGFGFGSGGLGFGTDPNTSTYSAKGSVYRGDSPVTFYAKGAASLRSYAPSGIFEQPTAFPTATGTGVAGEAGYEAIVPLRKSSDGSLGVRALVPESRRDESAPRTVHHHRTTVSMPIYVRDRDSFRGNERMLAGNVQRQLRRVGMG